MFAGLVSLLSKVRRTFHWWPYFRIGSCPGFLVELVTATVRASYTVNNPGVELLDVR